MATPELLDRFVRFYIEYSDKNSGSLAKMITRQREEEIKIIARTSSFCPYEKLVPRTMRAEDIEEALKEGYDDANILRTLMCMNNTLVLYPGGSSFGRNQKVRDFIRKLRQIGAESVTGYALLADIKGRKKEGEGLMVVKVPRRNDENQRLNQIHEYFVGVYGTNLLRSKIPNFAFILGIFQCSPPYIDTKNGEDREALTYCQNTNLENQVYYLLYENVKDSKTLADFITNGCTFEEYLNILVQVVFALDIAYRKIDFTHYDLHTDNVLIRELPSEIYIPYELENETYYLRTKYVATIIDLERSHIKYNGKDFGFSFIEASIFPDISYPLADIYKLLMFSLEGALGSLQLGLRTDQEIIKDRLAKNPEVFGKGRSLLTYFNPQLAKTRQVAQYLRETRKYFYSLPYLEAYKLPASHFFYKGINKLYPGLVSQFTSKEAPVDKVYGCAEKGVCYALERAINVFTEYDIFYLEDPYTFYEMLLEYDIIKPFESIEKIRLTPKAQRSQPLIDLLQEAKPLFEEYMRKLYSNAQEHLNNFTLLGRRTYLVSLKDSAPDRLRFDPDFLDSYRRFLARVVEMVDELTSFANIEIIVATLIKVYPDEAKKPFTPETNYTYEELIPNYFKPVHSETAHLNTMIRSVHEDVKFVESLPPDFKKDPATKWLFDKMINLTSAITQFKT